MVMKKFTSILVFCVAVSTLTCRAQADPPQTLRYFGELLHDQEEGNIWESECSKRIVSFDGAVSGGAIRFITPAGAYEDDDAIVRDSTGNIILDLRGTVWTKMPIVHVRSGGAESVREVYWMHEDLNNDGALDPPVPGMTAATGPEGDVLDFVEIGIAQVDSGDTYNADRYYLAPNSSVRLRIAIGLFKH